MQSIANIDAATFNAFIDLKKALDAELDKVADDLRQESAESDVPINSANIFAMCSPAASLTG